MAVAALMAVGTAVSIYGQAKQSEAEANAANNAAALKSIEAKETLERAKLNEESLVRESRSFQSNQESAFGAGNVDVGTGSPLLVLESTSAFYRREIQNSYRDASFRANQLGIEGSQYDAQAGDIRGAGSIRAAGTLLTAGANYYMNSGSTNTAKNRL